MRFMVVLLIGMLIGVPIGFLARSMLYRARRERCRYPDCTGLPANLCVDGLCPKHCASMHNCSEAFAAESSAARTKEKS